MTKKEPQESNRSHYVLHLRAEFAEEVLQGAGFTNLHWISTSSPQQVSEHPPVRDEIVASQYPPPDPRGLVPAPTRSLLLITTVPVEVPQLQPVSGQPPSESNPGLTLENAIIACNAVGLNLVRTDGPSGNAAHVIYQTPPPNTEVPPNSEVYVITWIPR